MCTLSSVWKRAILLSWIFFTYNAMGEVNPGIMSVTEFKSEADCNLVRNWLIQAKYKDPAIDPLIVSRFASPCVSQQTVLVEQ
jgi:hypothetical protein